ncbi:MAG: ABC transporter substrate-binding protein [Planctomycetota bacterium]|jgi:putative ABC transport system substrate-binding protein
MINKTHIYTALIIVLLILFHSAHCAHAEKTAIVIKSQDLSAYNEVIEGFQNQCMRNNINIKTVYDLKGKMKIGNKIVRKIRKEKPDIVLTIGVLAATVTKGEIKDIPMVFCMVINHARFQLTGPNITGISTEIAIEDQLKGYQSILGPLKNIGVIYDPSKTGNIIENAETEMKHHGVNLTKYEVTSSKMISEAMENLIGKIDALWLLPDSTVVTRKSFDFIKSKTLENKIPLLCTSDVFVKAGALAAVFADYKCIGRQAAELAEKILGSSTPDSLGIVNPHSFELAINTDTAEKLELKLEAVQRNPQIIVYP